jgi:hypothetical protein
MITMHTLSDTAILRKRYSKVQLDGEAASWLASKTWSMTYKHSRPAIIGSSSTPMTSKKESFDEIARPFIR